jgi:hypothetical protein
MVTGSVAGAVEGRRVRHAPLDPRPHVTSEGTALCGSNRWKITGDTAVMPSGALMYSTLFVLRLYVESIPFSNTINLLPHERDDGYDGRTLLL